MITIKTKDGNVEVDERDISLICTPPLLCSYNGIVYLKNADCIYSTQTVYQIKRILQDKGLYFADTNGFWGEDFLVSANPFIKYEERNVPHGTMESESRVEHPNYYKLSNGIEVLDVVRDLPFNIGNVVKYVVRAGKKKEAGLSDKQKQIEDLEKAKFYIEDAIKQLKDNNK